MKIVCFSEIQWRYVRTRKQQILTRLPDGWEILFLSSVVRGRPNNFLPARDGRVTHLCVPALKNFPQRPLRFLFSLPPVRFLWNVMLWLWLQVVFILTGFATRDRVLYVSNIYYAGVLRLVPRSLLLYDCNDDPLGFPGTPPWAEGCFITLARSADVAVAVSRGLEQSLREAGAANVRLIKNGVDFDLFQRAAASGVPPDMRGLARPVIGYVGAVAHWFDFDLLERLAKVYPAGSFVLVGPLYRDLAERMARVTDRHANVRLLGAKPYEELGAYVAAMDVCLIPLVVNELRRAADPNKLYEYAACGRPIVTMAYSDEIRSLAGLVYVAETADEFVSRVGEALERGADRERLETFARTRSWQARADEMAALIEEGRRVRERKESA